jgi:hypothetical protein
VWFLLELLRQTYAKKKIRPSDLEFLITRLEIKLVMWAKDPKVWDWDELTPTNEIPPEWLEQVNAYRHKRFFGERTEEWRQYVLQSRKDD